MIAMRTRLAPGQHYVQPDGDRRFGQSITIARLDRDAFGLPRVTFLAADGRELTAYAAQVEAAIAEGILAPLAIAAAA